MTPTATDSPVSPVTDDDVAAVTSQAPLPSHGATVRDRHHGLAPRFVIGSVNTAEVAVAVVASGSLLASVGGGGIDVAVVVAMLMGGVLAAPLAAWVIRFLPPRLLGVAVGGLLLVTNIRELTSSSDLKVVRWLAFTAVALACGIAAVRPRLKRARLLTS